MQTGSKSKNIVIAIFLSFSLLIGTGGCKSGQKASKQVRDAEKVEMQMEKEAEKELERARKQHHKMQSRQSRKMMKKAKRQSKKYNRAKKRSVVQRTFNKDCR